LEDLISKLEDDDGVRDEEIDEKVKELQIQAIKDKVQQKWKPEQLKRQET